MSQSGLRTDKAARLLGEDHLAQANLYYLFTGVERQAMRHLYPLFFGVVLMAAGLVFWFVAYKYKSESNRSYVTDLFTGNLFFLCGLYRLVDAQWLPGGSDAEMWMLIGTVSSFGITAYLRFLNWRDRRTQIPVKSILEPVRIANW